MSTIIVLAGSVAGFIAGLVGWLAFDLSLVAAMAVWIGAGPVSAIFAVAITAVGPAASRAELPDRALAEA